MKKALTLSIVIPVYNEESYLKPCLEAIAALSEPPDEVIVVDNNSTDQTAAIAQQYPFVHYIQEQRQGVLYARTTGFNAATGDIIGRIDGDTLLPEDWVTNVKAVFGDRSLAAVSGPVSYYDMPLEPLNFRIDQTLRTLVAKTNSTGFLFGTNMALRRSAWKAVRTSLCEQRDIHEDLDVAIHLQRLGRQIAYVPRLRARMSARRFDDNLLSFYRYLKMHQTSFSAHGIRSSLPYVTRFLYLLSYFILKPVRAAYNPAKGTFTLTHLLFGYNQPRKNPMDY